MNKDQTEIFFKEKTASIVGEMEKIEAFDNLEEKAREILKFFQDNQQLIEESEILKSLGIKTYLNYIRDNMPNLISQLENHKSDDIIGINHLEDQLGNFSMNGCGTIRHIINEKKAKLEHPIILVQTYKSFAQYLKNVLENENFLIDELTSFKGGETLH